MDSPCAMVVGLGRLGLPLAVLLANSGRRVIGVDKDKSVASWVSAKKTPIYEPGLAKMLDKLPNGMLRGVTNASMENAVRQSDIAVVLVPTPSIHADRFSNEYVLDVCKGIGNALQLQDGFFTVVISSTVMPGSCDGPIRSILEQTSGKKCGVGFGLCYAPEFVRLGSVISDMRAPDFVMIGASDPQSADIADRLFRSVRRRGFCMVRKTSLINAEIAKISLNAYMVMKITMANEIGELCEQYPGADAQVVTRALELDRRIGVSFQAATHAGGKCFPRDCRAFSAALRNTNSFAHADDAANWQYGQRLCARVIWELADFENPCVAILGLAFKKGTNVTEESFGMMLVEYLSPSAMITAYDPLVEIVQSEESAGVAIADANVVVLASPYKEFELLDFQKGQTVFDCWRLIGNLRAKILRERGVKLIQIGKGE